MSTTKSIGDRGEKLAEELLTGKGYAIVDRNVIIGNVEVDILAQASNRIIFIEVKTRKEDHFDPDFAIDREKLRRLARAADTYIRMKNLPHEAQIDAILVINRENGDPILEHLEDITLPMKRTRR